MIEILYTIIIYPITQIIELLFIFAQITFKEAGISLVFISLFICVLCLPLYIVAERWQETERNIQKRLSADVKKIKTAFKGDQQYMILQTFYRQNKYHPLYSLRTSISLLIQIPFFIAAFSYLSNLELLNGSSFLFILDLGKPDKLIPIAGGINLLPAVMTLINIISSAVYTQKLAIKEKIQLYGMALVFLLLLYNSPSGLVIYWTLNNIFSLVKNIYLGSSFKYKLYILKSIISLSGLLVSFYILFIHQGEILTRILIAIIFIIIGTLPWLISLFLNIANKIKIYAWSQKQTFFLFISAVSILWVSTGIFVPALLIVASPQEFSFIDTVISPLRFIFITGIQAFGLCFLWPMVMYLLFSEKIKKIFSFVFIVLSLSALMNVFLFPGNYGFISNDMVFAGDVYSPSSEIIINTLSLALLFAVIFILYKLGIKKIFSFLCVSFLSALTVLSCINIISINNEYNKLSEYYTPQSYNTGDEIKPIFRLSKTGENVLVIILDHAASVFIPYIFEESPDLFNKYDGFVFYPNTVSMWSRTIGNAPGLFGGYEYTPEGMNKRSDITLVEKRNEASLLMPYNFSNAGFSVTVTDPPFVNDNWIPDLRIFENAGISSFITDGAYTEIWLKRNNIILPPHSDILKRNILWYSIFKEIPLVFRPVIYRYGSWCAPFSEYRLRNYLNGYAVLDFLDELTYFDSDTENSFISFYNNTPHESYFLQAPDYRPQLFADNSGTSPFSREIWYHTNIASIKRIGEYLEYLKENDVYDNTRIIIVSDHGVINMSFVTKLALPFHVDNFNPLLMVKDFNGTGILKTEMSFMSNADIPFLAMDKVIDHPVNPFTGNPITTDRKKEPLFILMDAEVTSKNGFEIDINQGYYVHDNIFEIKNWTPFIKE